MRRIIVNKTPTVEDILLINNGVGPGFDSVRLFLASGFSLCTRCSLA